MDTRFLSSQRDVECLLSTTLCYNYHVHQLPSSCATNPDIQLSCFIECNPGPVQYPLNLSAKPVKRNQHGIMYDGCSHWKHAQCDVGEAEYLLLTVQHSEWFCPLCIQSKLLLYSSSLLDTNTLSMLLQPQMNRVWHFPDWYQAPWCEQDKSLTFAQQNCG